MLTPFEMVIYQEFIQMTPIYDQKPSYYLLQHKNNLDYKPVICFPAWIDILADDLGCVTMEKTLRIEEKGKVFSRPGL